MLHHVEVGDSVWAFTRNGEGRYVLAAELVVRAKTRNAPGSRYGAYRVWGDLKRSRYLRVDGHDASAGVGDIRPDCRVAVQDKTVAAG